MTLHFLLTRFVLPLTLICSVAVTRTEAQAPATTPSKNSSTAAESKTPAKPAENSGESKSPSEIDAQVQTDREAAAWGFVMTHHPQLGEVLSRLKIMHLGQYEKAINQITIAAERISRLQKADKKRGELELEDWKLGSQIQLAAAKLSLAGEDAENQQELTKIVRKQLEHRLRITEYERERTAARLKMLDDQIAKQKETIANSADARVNEMLREVNKTRKNLQTDNAKKPAKTKPAE